MVADELRSWLDEPDPERFPYDTVVDAYLRHGKHFVEEDVLRALAAARDALAPPPDDDPAAAVVRQFLRTALDKWDGTYDYPTYTALCVLPVPSLDDPPELAARACARRDRLVVQLVADLLGFELAVADGHCDLLPAMRPEPATLVKRCRLALRAAMPAVQRLGLADAVTSADPTQAARELCAAVDAQLDEHERRVLRLSMLPVYVAHDEYLFIRVLQLFEVTFAMLAVELRAAVDALARRDGMAAAVALDLAESVLSESAPLFSLLATMQVEAFRTFREFTEGASAIQSRNYKVVESLCRTPDPDRLASVAYLSVPEVRERVLAGNATLDEVFHSACTAADMPPTELGMAAAAMSRFSDSLLRWRRAHYGVAVRMLGERTGTGYTEGTPYLKAVQSIPVFRSIDQSAEDNPVELV